MIQTSGGITYEHATLPSAQHAEKRPLNIVEPQSDHPDTLPGLEIPSRHLDANMNTGPRKLNVIELSRRLTESRM